MDCEICGRNGNLNLVSLRGTQMNVCQKCGKYGVEVPEEIIQDYKPKIIRKVNSDEEDSFEYAENYSKAIQRARQQKSLNRKQLAQQINESESLLAKIEAGKIKPTEKVIKKLEKFLKIKIHTE